MIFIEAILMSEFNSQEDTEIKRDDLIFDLIKRRFDSETDRLNNLDSKASGLVGFVSIVVSLVLGGGSLLTGAETFDLPILLSNDIFAYLHFIGAASLLLSIGLALVALKVRRWTIVPDVKTLIEDYTTKDYREVLQRTAGEMAKAVVQTQKQNNSKAKFIDWSWIFLMIGLTIVFVSAIGNIGD